jgi:hypothetical protein
VGHKTKKVKVLEVMGRVEYSRPSLDGDGESLVGGGGVEGTASSAACAPPSCSRGATAAGCDDIADSATLLSAGLQFR